MCACLHADLQWTKTLVLHGRRGRPNELACKLADGWCWFCMVDAGSDFFACIQRPDGSIIVKKNNPAKNSSQKRKRNSFRPNFIGALGWSLISCKDRFATKVCWLVALCCAWRLFLEEGRKGAGHRLGRQRRRWQRQGGHGAVAEAIL